MMTQGLSADAYVDQSCCKRTSQKLQINNQLDQLWYNMVVLPLIQPDLRDETKGILLESLTSSVIKFSAETLVAF